MIMKKINVRELVAMTKEQIWSLPNEQMILVFDDGELTTYGRASIISWYYWEIHRTYPTAPIYKSHHVGNGHYKPSVHLNLASNIMWDTYFALNEVPSVDHLCRLVYGITGELYNDMTYRLESHITTVSLLDYVEIHEHPVSVEMREKTRPTDDSISDAYATMKHLLYKTNEMPNNNVTKFCRADLVSAGQVVQSVAPRGFVTEIDSRIFRHPIMNSYTEGMLSLQDSLVESRSGAKALLAQKDPLEHTEYFNRRMQLGCSVIQNLHMGDCGTKRTVKFKVRSESLNQVAGKFYEVTDENGDKSLQVVAVNQKSLIGETLKLRSSMVCEHPDPYGVCSTCMGQLALSVPRGTNIGHVAATELCAQVSQAVLSTKHLDVSSSAVSIDLSEYDRKYVYIGQSGDKIYIKKPKKFTKMSLVVDSADVKHIGDISRIEDVTELSSTKMSSCRYIKLIIENEEDEDVVVLGVSSGKNLSSLSLDMLMHLKDNGWSLNEDGHYVIDLTGWEYSKSILILPMKHMNMLDFMDIIKVMVESTSKSKDEVGGEHKRLVDYDSLSHALTDLHLIVAEKISVNIAHLEIIIRSILIRNDAAGDHRLPLPKTPILFGSYRANMENRSLSGLMAFEAQSKAFRRAESYAITNRMDHPMDVILKG